MVRDKQPLEERRKCSIGNLYDICHGCFEKKIVYPCIVDGEETWYCDECYYEEKLEEVSKEEWDKRFQIREDLK